MGGRLLGYARAADTSRYHSRRFPAAPCRIQRTLKQFVADARRKVGPDANPGAVMRAMLVEMNQYTSVLHATAHKTARATGAKHVRTVQNSVYGA